MKGLRISASPHSSVRFVDGPCYMLQLGAAAESGVTITIRQEGPEKVGVSARPFRVAFHPPWRASSGATWRFCGGF